MNVCTVFWWAYVVNFLWYIFPRSETTGSRDNSVYHFKKLPNFYKETTILQPVPPAMYEDSSTSTSSFILVIICFKNTHKKYHTNSSHHPHSSVLCQQMLKDVHDSKIFQDWAPQHLQVPNTCLKKENVWTYLSSFCHFLCCFKFHKANSFGFPVDV